MKRILGLLLDIILILALFFVIEGLVEYFILRPKGNPTRLLGFLEAVKDEGIFEWRVLKLMISANVLGSIITLVVSAVLYWLGCRALFKKTLGRKIFG